MANVNFYATTQTNFDAIATKEAQSFYYVTDGAESNLYFGAKLITNDADLRDAIANIAANAAAIGHDTIAESGTVGDPDYVAPAAATGLYKKIYDSIDAVVAGDIEITAINGVNTNGNPSANVQEALEALKALVEVGGSGSVITVDEDTTDTTVAKTYKIYQGGTKTGGATTTTGGTLVGEITIPLDLVVEEGSVVTLTFDDSTNKLMDGATDVTEVVKGVGGTATAADAGKYIKLVIANSNGDVLYISAASLVDIYTANNQTTEVTVAIDANNNVTATIGKILGTKIVYKEAVAGVGEPGDPDYVAPVSEESVTAAITRIEGVVGNLADGLDTTNDVVIATKDASTNVVTIATVAEENGIIRVGETAGLALAPVAATGDAADVAIADAGAYTDQTTVEGSLQEIYQKLTWRTI